MQMTLRKFLLIPNHLSVGSITLVTASSSMSQILNNSSSSKKRNYNLDTVWN